MLGVGVKSDSICKLAQQNWAWTQRPARPVVAHVDDNSDGQDLVDSLARRIGMIVEGISVVALHHLPCGDPSRSEAIDDCERAATQIWAPTGAICAMCAQAAGNGRRHRPRRNHRRVQDMHCEARALKECVLPSGGRGVSAGLTATSIEQDRVIIKVGRQSDKTCQCSPKRPPFLPSLCPSKVAFRLGTSILRGVRFNHPGVTIHSA
jgi:hypothetical protein